MLEWIKEHQGLIALFVTSLVAGLAWAFRTEVQRLLADRASATDLAKVASQVDDVDRRVIGIERQIEALPTAQQVHTLALSIETLRGDMRAIVSELRGTNELLRVHARKVELIDEFMHDRDGRRG